MILTVLLLALLIAAIVAWYCENKIANSARWISLISVIAISIVFSYCLINAPESYQTLQTQVRVAWISTFNIEFALALDQLSILLITLTLILAVICILVSWQEIQVKKGFYYFNLLASIAGVIGVFCAVDMFLFFFFWEVMLLPMTAIIAIWGHEKKYFAATKFFIFTQVSSLLMLIAIVATAYLHQQQQGVLSFYYQDWLNLIVPAKLEFMLMLGFFIAFAVKLPSVPLHSWLPDAHTQAPTAGSVLLAGVLLKTGAYGLIRFVILLFPQASSEFSLIAASLGVISILYGAKMAFAQSDFKRLIAYSSISHMGFVMLALFSFNYVAYQGAVLTMVAHGLSSAALFSLAGIVYSRVHSRDLRLMGGFWHSAPRMGGFALAFAAAALGLPGLANFIGEFFSLLGAFDRFPLLVILAAFGLIGSAIYGMSLFQSSFQGPVSKSVNDLSARELLINSSLLGLLLLLGLFPKLILSFQLGVSEQTLLKFSSFFVSTTSQAGAGL